jgi:hypothetical protein
MRNSCIVDWELHQKVMAKKNTITVCTGIGLDQLTPEYITIELASIDTEYHTDIKKSKKSKKNG